MSEKWVEFDKELGPWNVSLLGSVTYEKWLEVNSGATVTSTISVPPSNGLPGYSTTFSRTIHSRDLGLGIVQFTDPKSTIYTSMSYSNFRRK